NLARRIIGFQWAVNPHLSRLQLGLTGAPSRLLRESRDRLLSSGTTTTGVSWLRPNSVSKCVSGEQINCGTSADGISDPAGSVSVRLAYILWQVYMTVLRGRVDNR